MPNRALTLLNVDDDDANRYAVTRTLQKAGYIVEEAITGADALRMAQNRPALILLDVKLPDMSGFEVCRLVMDDTEHVPVSEWKRLGMHIRILAAVHDLLTATVKNNQEADAVSVEAALDRLPPQPSTLNSQPPTTAAPCSPRLPRQSPAARASRLSGREKW